MKEVIEVAADTIREKRVEMVEQVLYKALSIARSRTGQMLSMEAFARGCQLEHNVGMKDEAIKVVYCGDEIISAKIALINNGYTICLELTFDG